MKNPLKFKFSHSLAQATNDVEVGRTIVLNFLRGLLLTEEELDKELERLHAKYTAMLANSGRDENGNYLPDFCKGALALIDEIDSADGTLPEE